MKYYIDFETRSELDLTVVGASRYSKHESTSILCVAIKQEGLSTPYIFFDMGEFKVWVQANFSEADSFVAHNAFFERMLWANVLVKRYGFPEAPISQWSCTMAKCLNHGIPRALEQAAEALSLLQQKDAEGRRLMLKMCVPGGSNKAEDMTRLGRYCFQDNVVAEQIDKRLPDLCPFERRVWELDQKINDRGVTVDLPTINAIVAVLEREKAKLLAEFKGVTKGAVESPTQSEAFRLWLESELGATVKDITKGTVAKLLGLPVPPHVKRALEIRQAVSKSSTAKYMAMINTVDGDGRIRGHLVYHAAHTGRWGGAKSQMQNLPKPKHDVEQALNTLPQASVLWPMFFKNCFAPASSLVRSTIIPEPGKKFIGSDFSGIEARVTAFLAGQQDMVSLFKAGGDPYLHDATQIYGREITKKDEDERTIGKMSRLSLGFGGGIAAYYKMCAMYSVSLAGIAPGILQSASEEELSKAEFCYSGYRAEKEKAEVPFFNKIEGLATDIIKQRWRVANPCVVELWAEIEARALLAMENPGLCFEVCTGVYWQYGADIDFLSLYLPCRALKYFKPRVKVLKNKFGKQKKALTYAGLDSVTKQFIRIATYGGKLTENMVQAFARDIMVEAMLNTDEAGIGTVLTVHDELLNEVPEETTEAEIKGLMVQAKDWLTGLPLDASTWSGYRYRK